MPSRDTGWGHLVSPCTGSRPGSSELTAIHHITLRSTRYCLTKGSRRDVLTLPHLYIFYLGHWFHFLGITDADLGYPKSAADVCPLLSTPDNRIDTVTQFIRQCVSTMLL